MIPADTEILLNMASVLHDETVFEDPTKFKPERYLTGNIALKKQRTIPFGIGECYFCHTKYNYVFIIIMAGKCDTNLIKLKTGHNDFKINKIVFKHFK